MANEKVTRSILFMAQLPPPVHGAALRNKSLLESMLINSNFRIISLPLKFVDDLRDIGKVSFKKLLQTIWYSIRLFFLLLTRKIDLVYFTMSPSGGAFYRDIIFISIIKLFRKKVLLHFRVKGIAKTAASKSGERLVRYAFKNSDVIALSKHHMHDFEKWLHRAPIIVPNGIKVERTYLHFSDNQPLNAIPQLLFLSNLSRKKGIEDFILAMGMLKKKGYLFRASITGGEIDLTFEEVNQLLCKEGLNDIVEVTGPKYGEEKFLLLAKADIFVFPTYFELFPGVILEAMQFGKAIVSTFEGSIPEMIDNGENGLLVSQRDPVALAASIEALLQNPERRIKMGQLAREKFFREFTLEAFERRMNEVFEIAINRKA
jgi:glycosyltransferase involved in cell wall biosynthesis